MQKNAFWSQAPATLPEPARELSTETTSQALLQTPCRELHSGNVDSPQGTNHSPNAPLLSKATLAFFSPRPLGSIGQRGSGLPLAPWALMLCWGSPAPETHSKWVLLRGQVGLGLRKASAPWPQPSPLSQLGRSALRTRGSYGPKRASGSCILQKENLLGQQTTPPTRIGSGKQCKPFSPQALRSP